MKNQKNICITITSLASGGAEKQCLLLADVLAEYYRVIVVVINDQPRDQRHLDYIQAHRIKHIFLKGSIVKRIRDLKAIFLKNQITHIFTFLPADVFYAAISGRWAGVPHIFGGIRNSFLPRHKRWILRWLHNHLLSYSISNNFSGYKVFNQLGFKSEKIFVIPNGHIPPPKPIARKDRHQPVLTVLARFVKEKDLETAIKSVARVKNIHQVRNFVFRIIGHGPFEGAIRSWIKEYKLEGEVELIVRPSNIQPLLMETDIYLSTSLYEGLSNSIMEAMGYAVPVIATRVGDNERLIEHEKTGFLVNCRDEKAIAAYIIHLLLSYETRRKMGMNAYSRLRDFYNINQFKNQYIYVIEHSQALKIKSGKINAIAYSKQE